MGNDATQRPYVIIPGIHDHFIRPALAFNLQGEPREVFRHDRQSCQYSFDGFIIPIRLRIRSPHHKVGMIFHTANEVLESLSKIPVPDIKGTIHLLLRQFPTAQKQLPCRPSIVS
jgi:hypothetical protein